MDDFEDVTVTVKKRCKACNGTGQSKKNHACPRCMGQGRRAVEVDWGTFVKAVLTTPYIRATI